MNSPLEEVKEMKQKIMEQIQNEFELRNIHVNEKGFPVASHDELLECIKNVDQYCLDLLLKAVNDLPLELVLDKESFGEDDLKNLLAWLLDEDGEAACFDSTDVRYVEKAILEFVESKGFPRDVNIKDTENYTESLNLCLSFIANDERAEKIMQTIFFATMPDDNFYKHKALGFVLRETKTKEGAWWILNVLLAVMTKFVMVLEDEEVSIDEKESDKEYENAMIKKLKTQIEEISIKQRDYEYMVGNRSYVGGLNGDGGDNVETIPLNLTREKIEEILSPYTDEITEEALGKLSKEDLDEITKTVISTVGSVNNAFDMNRVQDYAVSGGITKMLLAAYGENGLSNLTAVKLSKSNVRQIMKEITEKVIEYDNKKTSFNASDDDLISYVIASMDDESAELLMNIGGTIVLSDPQTVEDLRDGVLGFIERASENKLDFTCFTLIFSNFIRLSTMTEAAKKAENYEEEALRVADLVQSYGINAVSDKDKLMGAIDRVNDIDVRKCIKYMLSMVTLSNSQENRSKKLSQAIIGINQLLGEPETPELRKITLDIRDAVWKAIEDLEIPVEWEFSEEQKNVSLLRALLSIASEHTEDVRIKHFQEKVSDEFKKMIDFYMTMEESINDKMTDLMDEDESGNEPENGSNEGESFEQLMNKRLGKTLSNGAVRESDNGEKNGSNKKPKSVSIRDLLLNDDDD